MHARALILTTTLLNGPRHIRFGNAEEHHHLTTSVSHRARPNRHDPQRYQTSEEWWGVLWKFSFPRFLNFLSGTSTSTCWEQLYRPKSSFGWMTIPCQNNRGHGHGSSYPRPSTAMAVASDSKWGLCWEVAQLDHRPVQQHILCILCRAK